MKLSFEVAEVERRDFWKAVWIAAVKSREIQPTIVADEALEEFDGKFDIENSNYHEIRKTSEDSSLP